MLKKNDLRLYYVAQNITLLSNKFIWKKKRKITRKEFYKNALSTK